MIAYESIWLRMVAEIVWLHMVAKATWFGSGKDERQGNFLLTGTSGRPRTRSDIRARGYPIDIWVWDLGTEHERLYAREDE